MLTNILSPFQIVFEAIRGGGYQGDISLDDVYFEDGFCRSIVPPPNPKPQGNYL